MRLFLAVLTAATLACALPARAQSSGDRGQLLYDAHCVQCHNAQVHWRDKRLVTDWGTLKYWVAHWQREAALDWSNDDVAAVARYLNGTIYQFPEPQAAR
jgi:hypothetical protein